MRVFFKILISFLISILIATMPHYNVKASIVEEYIDKFKVDLSNTVDKTNDEITEVTSIVSDLLGFIRVVSAVLLAIVIASGGFRYIVETPDVKEEIKKDMLPIIVGIIFVFCATSIAKFIIGLFVEST